jgi:DNA-binding transcriptional ArsR family regulator
MATYLPPIETTRIPPTKGESFCRYNPRKTAPGDPGELSEYSLIQRRVVTSERFNHLENIQHFVLRQNHCLDRLDNEKRASLFAPNLEGEHDNLQQPNHHKQQGQNVETRGSLTLLLGQSGLQSQLSITADVFNAIAEPRRRQIVELLARRGAQAVGTLVVTLGLPQPAVSKHLSVLRKVGVVAVIKQGKQRVYKLEAEKLKTVHDWVKAFEELWGHQLDRIKERAEHRAREQTESPTPLKPRKGRS